MAKFGILLRFDLAKKSVTEGGCRIEK